MEKIDLKQEIEDLKLEIEFLRAGQSNEVKIRKE